MRASLFVVVILAAVGCGSSVDDSVSSNSDADVADVSDARVSSDATSPATGPYAGDPCSSASDCPKGGSGTTVCLTSGFPGGYCAVTGCADHGHDCPNDPGNGGIPTTTSGKCVKYDKSTACLRTCNVDGDCRAGYNCAARDDAAGHGTARVCLPRSTSADAGMTGGDGGMGTGMGGDGCMGM